jgi:hypothetical protein
MTEHPGHSVAHDEGTAAAGSDIDLRGILTFAAGLAALMAVVYLVVWLLFGYLNRKEAAASGGRLYPLAAGQDERLPPEPRLQTNPRQDLKDLRAAEDRLLTSYQWVDRNNNVVRIPIDEAMKLTLQRGLPSRPATGPRGGR